MDRRSARPVGQEKWLHEIGGMKRKMHPSRQRAAAAVRALREHKQAIDHAIECLERYAATHQRLQAITPRDELRKAITLAWQTGQIAGPLAPAPQTAA